MTGNSFLSYVATADTHEIESALTLSAEELKCLQGIVSSYLIGGTAQPQNVASMYTASGQMPLSAPCKHGNSLTFEFLRSFNLRIKCTLAKRNAGVIFQDYKVTPSTGSLALSTSGFIGISDTNIHM